MEYVQSDVYCNYVAFGRLAREIAGEYKSDLRMSKLALEALQLATEWYMVKFFKDTKEIALSSHRTNIFAKDMQLAKRLRESKEKQYTF